MSADGLILRKELPSYPGYFLELNPIDFPVTTLAGRNGFRNEPKKTYALTRHSNPAVGTSNNKPDNASVTYGSTGFTTGSQTMQILFEGVAETWAGKGDQDLGRTLGHTGPTNPSMQAQISNIDRGRADALMRMKGQLEFQALYGVFADPAAGTTALPSQRGLRNADSLLVGTAAGATPGTGTLGTTGTLTRAVVFDHLASHYNQKLWGSEGLVVSGGASAITALNYMFMDEFNMGKNGVSHQISGIDLTAFHTPYGDIFTKITRDPADATHLWFLNPAYMDMVARPVPGKGVFFEKVTSEPSKAHDSIGIYAEAGFDYVDELAHSLILGVASTAAEGVTVI
jgi:hypothetical protein